MNFEKLKSGTILAAAVMILVTFAPEAALAPVKQLFSQVRMNNVSSASSQSPVDTSLTDAITEKMKKMLR